MNNKTALLQELIYNTFVRVLPSKTNGIGVFAIKEIPKACRNMFSDTDGDWLTLSFEEVEQLPKSSRELVENFCLFDEKQYFIPAHGFKSIDLSLFLNHSDQPNIISIDEGRYFESLRDIQVGEELLIDYGTIVSK